MLKKVLEKIFRAPARVLDQGLEASREVKRQVMEQKSFRMAEEYWNTLGPGLTTGAADDDPSGIATYSQTGAKYGLQLLWLVPFTFPLMATVQEMCARIGLVTGEGLAGNIKRYYAVWVLYLSTFLLFVANTFNLGADLGAMAKAAQLLNPRIGFTPLILVFTFLSLYLQIFTTYARYAKYLKYLALVLFSYVFSALAINLNWHEVLSHAVFPSITFSRDQIFLICAVLGTTISPYLFFWQTSQEVEEEILRGKVTIEERRVTTTREEIKRMRTDVWSGMFVSNVVMFFIIVTCAATLFSHDITNINTAEEAALALRPLAGEFAFLLFAMGIIGTGLLSVPILAGSASYALSESFGWDMGLHLKLRQAHAFYGVIVLSMLIGLSINFLHLDPIKMLIYSAVANGLIAPVVLILIVKISSNKEVMGEHVNKPATSFLGWFVVGLMTLSGIAALGSMFF
jgi:NRAMP (natural resistance-associated macrophage protein)-like metal ion transporter